MTPEANDLVRGLARRLCPFPTVSLAVHDDQAAIRLFVDVAHDGRCPGCDGRRWRPCGLHHLDCSRCGRLSAFHNSALARRRVAIRDLLAAIFAVFVDTTATSARGFSRRQQLRLDSSWRLLHDIREALPRATAQQPGIVGQVLGGSSAANAATALLADDGDRLVALDADDGGPPGVGRPDLSLWLGRLRGWLTEVFRGVSAKHLWRYLAEFAARHGRVARGGASHI